MTSAAKAWPRFRHLLKAAVSVTIHSQEHGVQEATDLLAGLQSGFLKLHEQEKHALLQRDRASRAIDRAVGEDSGDQLRQCEANGVEVSTARADAHDEYLSCKRNLQKQRERLSEWLSFQQALAEIG